MTFMDKSVALLKFSDHKAELLQTPLNKNAFLSNGELHLTEFTTESKWQDEIRNAPQ